jgi:ketosteroid isomerase-like protein
MTPTNVEIVRSIFTAWERGDYSSADWADPDIEFELADGPSPGRWTGIPAMARAWGQLLHDAFAELRVEGEAYRELADGRVLVLTQNSGRGKSSGLELGEMRTRGANVFELRDGKVTRLVLYWERERALREL